MEVNKTVSLRKYFSEHKWLQSRNCSTQYYRQYRVILLADGDCSQQLNSQGRGSKQKS
jgi:hypothetical protein